MLQSRRKPLKIIQVVVHKSKDSTTYILGVKNRKNYPVEIQKIRNFAEHKYKVEQKVNEPPDCSEILSFGDNGFSSSETFTIGQNGYTDVFCKTDYPYVACDQFIFSMQTSHGYHLLKCKNIIVSTMGTNTHRAEFIKTYNSKFEAILKYYSLKWKYYSKKLKYRSP